MIDALLGVRCHRGHRWQVYLASSRPIARCGELPEGFSVVGAAMKDWDEGLVSMEDYPAGSTGPYYHAADDR